MEAIRSSCSLLFCRLRTFLVVVVCYFAAEYFENILRVFQRGSKRNVALKSGALKPL